MKISVVTSLYFSETTVNEFYKRVVATLKQLNISSYEIIFVDDGSPDASLSQALKLVDLDNHVVAIELSRNFGHHHAIMAGLEQSRGDFVFLIDSDLEEAPELLADFYNVLLEYLRSLQRPAGIRETLPRRAKIFGTFTSCLNIWDLLKALLEFFETFVILFWK